MRRRVDSPRSTHTVLLSGLAEGGTFFAVFPITCLDAAGLKDGDVPN